MIRWYFAIDAAGGSGAAGAYAKLAVLSAQAVGGLAPVLLYHGVRNDFTTWMLAQGVEVIDTIPSFSDAIEAAVAAGTYRLYSPGHWLRAMIPLLEEQKFALYTDCDVVFLAPVKWQEIEPRVFAAAPEFWPDNWNYINTGVMLLNIGAMRASFDGFEKLIRGRIGATPYTYDDQVAFNEAYRGHWQRLDPRLNWKPYWGFKPDAAILHFHGPKFEALEAIAAGRWKRDTAAGKQLAAMTDSAIDGYIAWCTTLGDRLQSLDLATAMRCLRLASALTLYRPDVPAEINTSFRQFRMFGE